MPTCSILRHSDLEWIVDELRALPTESLRFSDVPDNVSYVHGQLEQMLLAGVLFGTVMPERKSFMLGVLTRPWYADRLEAQELILWIPRRYRGAWWAIKLIEHFTVSALDFNPHSIHAGVSLDITDANRVLALYEKCGYSRDSANGVIMRL